METKKVVAEMIDAVHRLETKGEDRIEQVWNSALERAVIAMKERALLLEEEEIKKAKEAQK